MISIFSKLKNTLSKTSEKISYGIDTIFHKRNLDDKTLEELEELLISADISLAVSAKLIAELKSTKLETTTDGTVIKQHLVSFIQKLLVQSEKTITLDDNKLNVILVCGVNGSGKTTTIGKLAANYTQNGKKVAVAACDTFRAAAISQLASWAERAGTMLITGEMGSDPASVAYRAMQESTTNNVDILFIDTAGRLHNKKNLMDELGKIVRVIKKIDDTAPHYSLLVIDSTTGQNVLNQVEQFSDIAHINGLVITKLDSSAKAGVVLGATAQYSLPIYFIGVGEQIEDLKQFNAKAFAENLVGMGDNTSKI